MSEPTMPSKTLLQGKEYVNAASTDIRATFAAYRAALVAQKPANVRALKKAK